MKNSFSNIPGNMLTRKFGGSKNGVADPYVTGYHFIYFTQLPTNLLTYVQKASATSAFGSNTEIANILSATCLSVTPPGGTLNKVEFTGLGGVKWAVPGNIDYGNSVSVKFFEMSGTPILDIMHGWFRMIRDYRTGITGLEDTDTGDGYSNKTYSAAMYYWTTAPDAKTIEYYACYDGMFPNKDPQDLFSSDVESVGKLDIEIEFNVDYAYHEPWVKTNCKTYMDLLNPDGLALKSTAAQYS